MFLNYVVTLGWFTHAGAIAMCLSAARCLPAVPASGAQQCPAVPSCACQRCPAVPSCAQRHPLGTGCVSGCHQETQNNPARESVLGTDTARVSALEMLCFDKLPGDFSSSWFNQSCW